MASDRRGRLSDRPGEGYDYDTLADDLADVISHLGLSGIMLVGDSMRATRSPDTFQTWKF
ncbi:hypothetical protein ACPOL_4797 [Acidisarcina polymorpha]|uniref:Uncharacterized protein n=1 Tax=Acidisarcina polymorpha TaxID=2211140 RepID=A0A2Z5G4D2_9BACT|nr:hypothetical protein ACPOL_4797 [Acidisarcina polymorpha]